MKKVISLILAIAVFASCGIVFAENPYKDTNGHWAETQIGTWSEYGVISGYAGEFAPDRSITRGEFAVVLNRLMTYDKTVENRFADLTEKYYTDSILKLNKAGVMQGYDGKISPEASLTREEAAVMICRALGIETQSEIDKEFTDYSYVSEWAKPYINALVNAGLLNGSYGKLNPKNTITRAEVVTILDNAVLPVLKVGEYGGFETNKILVISSGSVTINQAKINGKIIITQGAKSGNITFIDSEINGKITIDNDREKFIALDKTTVSDKTILENNAFSDDKKNDESGGNGSGNGGNGNGGNSGGDDSGNSGDTPGGDNGNSGDTPGGDSGNTGDTPGGDSGNTGDTPGGDSGNTGDTPGGDSGNTGDTPGGDSGNTGDTPGGDSGNTGDTPGGDSGNTGDTPGGDSGNTGDTPGGDEDIDPDEPIDYETINKEMVDNLQLVSDDIAMYIDPTITDFYTIFTNEEKYILRKIKVCIDDAISHQKEVEIDADYIKNEYDYEIGELKGIYEEMKVEGRSGAFHSRLFINLNSYTLFWLAETLGIDTSDYGINPEDYIKTE